MTFPPFVVSRTNHEGPPVKVELHIPRLFIPVSRRDPHVVLRIDRISNEALVKYADRTTDWHAGGWYQQHSRPMLIILEEP